MALSTVAMVVMARSPADRAVRRTCLAGAAAAIPAQGAAGLAVLLVGHGTLTGILERAALAAALGWLIAVPLASTRSLAEAPRPGPDTSKR
jgi:hypothetical protein